MIPPVPLAMVKIATIMKKVKLAEATASLAEYTRKLRGPLVVTANGKPIAALVPIEGADMETLAVGTNPKFLDIIERSRRRGEAEGSISSEEMRRRLGLPPFDPGKSKAKPSRTKTNGRKTTAKSRAKKNGGQV